MASQLRIWCGYRLTTWLFGGERITTEAALFDLAGYDGNIVRDLFGEDSYFDDPSRFWTHQNTAIANLQKELEADGWAAVEVMEVGARFPSWNYVDTAKEDGGKVFIQISQNGEVTVFKGQLDRDELRKRDAKDTVPVVKSELTKPMQTYLALHRHAAVRSELASDPALAMRVAVAQMIANSALVSAHADPQKTGSVAIETSLAENKAEAGFAQKQKAVSQTLNRKAEEHLVFHVLCNGELEELNLEETTDLLRAAMVERFLIFNSAASYRFDIDGKRLEWGHSSLSAW